MTTTNAIPPILASVLQMPAGQQRAWLAQQTPATKQNLLALIRHHKTLAEERSWELKQEKRAAQAVWNEAGAALKKATQAYMLIQQELQLKLGTIYANPQEAMRQIWAQAQQAPHEVHSTLQNRPETYGTLKNDFLLVAEIPTQFKARKTAQTLRFEELWKIYQYSWQAKSFLESKLVTEDAHGSA